MKLWPWVSAKDLRAAKEALSESRASLRVAQRRVEELEALCERLQAQLIAKEQAQ